MRIHHKLSHGESLAKEKTTCKECGNSFEYYPSDKDGVYCTQCAETVHYGGTPTLEGEDNPMFKGGDVSTSCSQCNKPITRRRWRYRENKNHFCSQECQSKFLSEVLSGREEKIQIECDWCGEKFDRKRSQCRYENQFCDKDCRGKWFSNSYNGEEHPRWEGGSVDYYGSEWDEKRKDQLERDNYQCVVCGKCEEDIGTEPHVHHRKPVRNFDDPNDAHFEENLVSLCPKHHALAENNVIEV